jgi:hypothetical protein
VELRLACVSLDYLIHKVVEILNFEAHFRYLPKFIDLP